MTRVASMAMLAVIAHAATGCVLALDPERHEIPDVMPVDELCPRLIELSCAGHFDCCEPPYVLDREACETQTATICDASLARWARDERTGYDGARASVLFRQAYDELRACRPELLSALSSRDGLRAMFAGTVELGGSCQPGSLARESIDAAAFFSCRGSENACLLAGLGDPLPFTCQPARAQDGLCFSSLDCGEGLFCQRLTEEVGLCRPRQGTGVACTASEQCESLICVAGTCAALTRANAYGCER